METRSITVCRSCLNTVRRPARPRNVRPPQQWFRKQCIATITKTADSTRSLRQQRRSAVQPHPSFMRSGYAMHFSARDHPSDLNAVHSRIQELSNSVLKPNDGQQVPEEQRILYVLEQLEALSHTILDEKRQVPARTEIPSKEPRRTATASLLGSVNARQHPALITTASLIDSISNSAETIVRHPNVFVSPAVLKAYIELQTLLRRPASFPDIFNLYAHKSIPTPTGATVSHKPSSPDAISSAVPSASANTALTCAISAHDLPLAIDIIATTFSAPAYKKAKILRQAAIPISGFAVAPVAAYVLSTQFSALQQTMDPGMATTIAFAGIMTYVGAVGMVGYVAVTTANDQMDRVTWASGVPLWERWIREEERAAIDRVAGAWGFNEAEKRGDEEGAEWDALREWTGRRGMILDRVSLLEGME